MIQDLADRGQHGGMREGAAMPRLIAHLEGIATGGRFNGSHDTTLHATAVERPDTDVSFLLEFRKARERTPSNRRDFEDVTIALVNDAWVGTVGKMVSQKEASPLGAKFLQALQNALAGGATTTFQSWKAVTMDQWRAECCTLGLIDMDKVDSARSLLSKYKRELIGCNLIACNNDLVWINRP